MGDCLVILFLSTFQSTTWKLHFFFAQSISDFRIRREKLIEFNVFKTQIKHVIEMNLILE